MDGPDEILARLLGAPDTVALATAMAREIDGQDGWRQLPDLLGTFIESGDPAVLASLPMDEGQSAYLSCVSSLIARIREGDQNVICGRKLLLGREFDALALPARANAPLRWLGQWLVRQVPKTKQIAVVVCMRNEGLAIVEWVAHYQALGIDSIFVYVNDTDDGSLELLDALADTGILSIIRNEISPTTPPQRKAYEHAVNLSADVHRHEWVFFLDADEFFVPAGPLETNLGMWLRQIETQDSAERFSSVLFNWKWFGSENTYSWQDRLLAERFPYGRPNPMVKTLGRIHDVVEMASAHHPLLLPGRRAVNASLQPIACSPDPGTPAYGVGQINHYWNKSFEEYVAKKQRGRGWGGMAMTRGYEDFFEFGNNFHRGDLDRPNPPLLARVQAQIDLLMTSPRIAEHAYYAKYHFRRTINALAVTEDLASVYQNGLNRRLGIATIAGSGIFDADHYGSQNPQIAGCAAQLLEHSYEKGWREGRAPSLFFDPVWYHRRYMDLKVWDRDPLLHYVLYGDREGRRPSPWFDTVWYRIRYGVHLDDLCLSHYLAHRAGGAVAPNREFDPEWYLERNPDVAAGQIDPYDHFIRYGFFEGRRPSAGFQFTDIDYVSNLPAERDSIFLQCLADLRNSRRIERSTENA